jgi:hypothetical protein
MTRPRAPKEPLADGDQLLMDLQEIRERLHNYHLLRLKETGLQEQEAELSRQLRELRRKLKECRWDLRNATNAVDKTAKAQLPQKEGKT